jgi:hypothetical protein
VGWTPVLRELRFGAVPGVDAAGPGATREADEACFRFVMDFDSAERWPDVPYDTAAPSARHDDAARSRIFAVLDEAAQTMARRAPAALRLVNGQLQRVLLRHGANASGRVGVAPLSCRQLPADQSARADRSGAGDDRGRHP